MVLNARFVLLVVAPVVLVVQVVLEGPPFPRGTVIVRKIVMVGMMIVFALLPGMVAVLVLRLANTRTSRCTSIGAKTTTNACNCTSVNPSSSSA